MSSKSNEYLEQAKVLINQNLDFILEFAEYIIGERPSERSTSIVAEARLLQEKMTRADTPFVKTAETLKHQSNLLYLIINWNPAISSQLLSIANFYHDINKVITGSLTIEEFNPFTHIFQNYDKFNRASDATNEIFKKYMVSIVGPVDLYPLFYLLIASVESIEFPIYKGFIQVSKKYNLDIKYDANVIFSVTGKKNLKKDTKLTAG